MLKKLALYRAHTSNFLSKLLHVRIAMHREQALTISQIWIFVRVCSKMCKVYMSIVSRSKKIRQLRH